VAAAIIGAYSSRKAEVDYDEEHGQGLLRSRNGEEPFLNAHSNTEPLKPAQSRPWCVCELPFFLGGGVRQVLQKLPFLWLERPWRLAVCAARPFSD
jgi:hypothetical protein